VKTRTQTSTTRSGKPLRPLGEVLPTASRNTLAQTAGKKSTRAHKQIATELLERYIGKTTPGPFCPSLDDFQCARSLQGFKNTTMGTIKQSIYSRICELLPDLYGRGDTLRILRSVKLLLYSGIFDAELNEIITKSYQVSISGIIRTIKTRFETKHFVYLYEFLRELEGNNNLWFWVYKMLFWLDYNIIEGIKQALGFAPDYCTVAEEVLQEFFLKYDDSVSPDEQCAIRSALANLIEDIDNFLDIPSEFSTFKQSLPNKPPPSIKEQHRKSKLCIKGFEQGLNERTEYWRARLEQSESLQHFVAEFTNPTTVSYILNKYQSLQKLKERLSLEPSAARQVINFDAI